MSTDFTLPNLGENSDTADVVKILVSVGDAVQKDQPVVELETGKAVLELPSAVSGLVKEIYIKPGETIKVGQRILSVDAEKKDQAQAQVEKPQSPSQPSPTKDEKVKAPTEVPAAPAAKRLAREKGIDLSQMKGSGPRGLIMAEDVKKMAIPSPSRGEGQGEGVQLPNFSKWGPVELVPMTSVRRQTASHMTQSWSTIPHVTQTDWADITDLEKLRKQYQARAEAQGGKLTWTVIILKIVASALKVFPKFNSSVDINSNQLIYKKYYHLGVAVDTERGLLVPVIRNVDQKNILGLSIEVAQMAEKARNRKLILEEMQGSTFSITNLGGIGGGHFTPLIQAPEVAVLGIGRSRMEPLYIEDQFQPRLMMPLSLSYDHRVIDGADAARFLRWVAEATTQPFLMELEG